MSKLIVFDVDGTFLNSWEKYEQVVLKYSEEHGLPVPCLKSIAHGYGHPDDFDFGWGVSKQEQRKHLYATFDITDHATSTGEPHLMPALFEGAEKTFMGLKEIGYALAIITSKPEKPLLKLLDHYGVDDLFDAYRSVDDVHKRQEKEKPEPDMLHSVMRELSFQSEDTVMVGDTTMDMRMGRAADAHTIGVTWGMHLKEHLIEAGAHHLLENGLHEIEPLVKKIFR